MDKRTKTLVAVSVVLLVLVAFFAIWGFGRVSKDAVASQLAVQKAELEAQRAKDVSALNEKMSALGAQVNGLNNQIGTLTSQVNTEAGKSAQALSKISELEKAKAELEKELAQTKETAAELEGIYQVDDLVIGKLINLQVLSDREVSKLFDGEITFATDKYDVEEVVLYGGMVIANDNEDYNGEAFLTVPEEGIEYRVIFDNELVLADIGVDDNYLNVNFLGQPMEITKWVGNEITVRRGTEYTVKEGESVTIGDKQLTALFVGEDGKAEIAFDGISKTFSEGQTRDFNGVDVFLSDVLYNSRLGMITVRVGNDVKETYTNGDEFVKDSIWVWNIDGANKELGVKLNQEFSGNDPEEDYNALAYGKSLGLPNNYVAMTFDGLVSEQYTPIKMEQSTKNSVDYIRLTGKFEQGTDNYVKLYVELTTGQIYGLDDNNDLVALTSPVEVEGTDYLVSADASKIFVQDASANKLLVFKKDFTKAFADLGAGLIQLGEDEAYINTVGMRVKAVSDFSDNERFEFSVPDEAIKALISFK
jgi:molybdopterin converting factor small subunit